MDFTDDDDDDRTGCVMSACAHVFLRLPGAEGPRLQGREICGLRNLRGFDCSGGRQPRWEDHPRWRRPVCHPGTCMFTHTVDDVNVLSYRISLVCFWLEMSQLESFAFILFFL